MSNHPLQHKRSVVDTLLDRAEKIPSTNRGKRQERKHIIKVLRDNGYPLQFISNCNNKDDVKRRNQKIYMKVMMQHKSQGIQRVMLSCRILKVCQREFRRYYNERTSVLLSSQHIHYRMYSQNLKTN